MTTIELSLAVLLEQFEENAWTDMYQAAPAAFVNTFGLSSQHTPEGTFFFCKKIPFVHFNCIITLGLNSYVTKEQINNFETQYRHHNCEKAFAIISPFAKPPALKDMLKNEGFKNGGAWDRVYRNNTELIPLASTNRNFIVEEVKTNNSKEWSDFICDTYGLPTQQWLLAVAERKGWHHFILRENNKIIEVRSFYSAGAYVWIGIDAPVPGMMTQDFEADYVLMHAMIKKGLEMNAKHFIADIEMPDDKQQAPSYRYFKELGFSIEYKREIFVKELK